MNRNLHDIVDLLFGGGMCIAGVIKRDWVYLALGVLLINSVTNTGGYMDGQS